MKGETAKMRSVNKRVPWVIAALVLGLVGCAKTDAQAPAKEAPSATAFAPESLLAEEAAPAPPPSPASADRWPQAEAAPGGRIESGAGGAPKSGAAPVLAPAPRDKSDDAKKKESAAPRAAAKPAKSEIGASEGRADLAADEAEPALAVTESWTQLNVAFDELTSALALSVPNCGAAERFRQNVCALAERICTLERDLPSTTPHNCSDGRSRCSDATNRYNAKCDH